MADPIFTGRVLEGGLLVLDRPKDYARYVRQFSGKYVELVCRRRGQKRTNPQNRWLWGYAYPTILKEWGYERSEIKGASEELHEKYVGLCFGTHWDDRMKKDVRNVRTSQLSTVQFSEYMEWLPRHVAQAEGIVLMLPNEVDYRSIPEEDAA
jgi:hypothetical protein